jgi:hypothetical protein
MRLRSARHWYLWVAALAVSAVALSGAVVYASGDSPTYFVDGARPNGDTTSGSTSGGQMDGCVPYSAEREDVTICGSSVPDDYQPPPLPYYDEEKCTRAQAWIEDQREAMMSGGASASQIELAWPDVPTSSCLIDEGAPTGRVIVTFVPAPGEDRLAVTIDAEVLGG